MQDGVQEVEEVKIPVSEAPKPAPMDPRDAAFIRGGGKLGDLQLRIFSWGVRLQLKQVGIDIQEGIEDEEYEFALAAVAYVLGAPKNEVEEAVCDKDKFRRCVNAFAEQFSLSDIEPLADQIKGILKASREADNFTMENSGGSDPKADGHPKQPAISPS